jgi:hypothetical protein
MHESSRETDTTQRAGRALAGTVVGTLAGLLVAVALTYVWLRLYGEARPVADNVSDRERAILSTILIGSALVTVVISTAMAAFATARARGHVTGAAALILLASLLAEAVMVFAASFDNFCRYGQTFPWPGFSGC